MAKKQKRAHKAIREKSKEMQKASGKDTRKECIIEAAQSISGIDEFISRFKSDVEKKRRAFKSFSLTFHKKEQ